MRIISASCFILLILSSEYLSSQSPSLQNKAIILKRVIEKNHYAPRTVNDSFSLFVFKNIINILDSRLLFFTKTEYKELETLSLKIDDELNGGKWVFLNRLLPLYKKSLIRADSIIKITLSKPLNFALNESITVSMNNDYSFAITEADLANRWGRYLKVVTGEQIYYTLHSDSQPKTISLAETMKVEAALRNKVKKAELKFIKGILDYKSGFENYIAQLYLDAIASAFDPHTNYFSQEGKEVFQSAISSEELSFGLELEKDQKGRFIISHLQPGGPAWKSGELHKGDELTELQDEGKESILLAGESLEDIYELLFTPVQSKLSFKIRKSNGVEKTVVLRKEKIDNEENIVRSFILNGNKKVGYIILPGFYTEWENENGSSCAADVAKEIVNLKKENIEGLILDVRYNGGGSIGEALDMAGIFIDEGPLTARKERLEKIIYLKDPNRGMIYSGPMVLLVNGQSASASEMLAASLQDYNRAVIAGSNTFGKATMQDMFALDTITKNQPGNNTDIVKITTAKFYRLNGLSAQLNGVKPDVVIPEEFDLYKTAEKYYPNALPSDTIKKNSYYKSLPPLPLLELIAKSTARINKDTTFQEIKKLVNRNTNKGIKTSETIPLQWENFEKWVEKNDKAESDISVNKNPGVFTVDNHQQIKKWLSENADERESNDLLISNISEDIILRESFLILCDLINLQKTNH